MRNVIGIDRRIKRHWLDQLLDRLVQTVEERPLRAFLDEQLKSDLPGKSSRKKSVGILMKTWCRIPEERLSLRERAVALLPRISGRERLWLHWGMMSQAYPFFRDTTEVVGRLLALQDDISGVAVQSRLTKAWGDRITTKLAARHLMQTLVDWEVLRKTKQQGHFLLVQKVAASTPELQIWLIEALLGASVADEIEAQQLLRLPETFPFTISLGVGDLRRHEGFHIYRQGLDMDMVSARRIRSVAVPQPESLQESVPTSERVQAATPARRRRSTLFDDEGDDHVSGGRSTPAPEPSGVTTVPGRKTTVQRRMEKQLREEFQQSLDGRIARSLMTSGLALQGLHEMHPVRECVQLFRDGYVAGCLALGRDLLENSVLQRAQRRRKTPLIKVPEFTRNVASLRKSREISDEFAEELKSVWEKVGRRQHTETVSTEGQMETARALVTVLLRLETPVPNTDSVRAGKQDGGSR